MPMNKIIFTNDRLFMSLWDLVYLGEKVNFLNVRVPNILSKV